MTNSEQNRYELPMGDAVDPYPYISSPGVADDQILAQQNGVRDVLSDLETGLKEKVDQLVAERR
jgi:hypothetical protein